LGSGSGMKGLTNLDAIVDQVVENARQSAVVIGRRLAPSFWGPPRVVDEQEERVAAEEAVQVDAAKLKDVPFEPMEDDLRSVVGVDGGQRYCGELEDAGGIVGAVKAAAVTTVKVDEALFQVDKRHCFTLGPYLLPFLWDNDRYIGTYNRLLVGLFGEYGVKPLQGVSKDKLIDRARNLIEKFAQLKAIQRIRDAIVVFDGATTLDTVDTPRPVMTAILQAAADNDNVIVGVSKNSSLRVGNQRLLETIPPFPPGARLKDCHLGIPDKLRDRIAGRVFAARFTEFGRVFRLDTIPADDRGNAEAHYTTARLFLSSDLFSRASGYPNSVALADMESNLAGGACEQILRARALQEFKITMAPRVSMVEKLRRFGSYIVFRQRF
jgi:hypothetical protein